MHDPERLWCTSSEWDPVVGAFTAPGKGSLASEVSQEPSSTEYVCGAALFFRANVARRIGLLDERFFLVYEDSDWGFRARRAGFGCMTIPAGRVWHKVGTSFGSESSPLRTYFSIRATGCSGARRIFRWRERTRMLATALRRLLPALRVETGAAGDPRPSCGPFMDTFASGGECCATLRKSRVGGRCSTTFSAVSAIARRRSASSLESLGQAPSPSHPLPAAWGPDDLQRSRVDRPAHDIAQKIRGVHFLAQRGIAALLASLSESRCQGASELPIKVPRGNA